VDVEVRDPALREVDAVAARDPVGEGVEVDVAGEERPLRLLLARVELPDERVPLDRGRAEERPVARDVVDDPVAPDRLDPGRELVEGESQWK
jgi:hypothetical protein